MQDTRQKLERLDTAALDAAIDLIRERMKYGFRHGFDHTQANRLKHVLEQLLRPVRETVRQMEAAGLAKLPPCDCKQRACVEQRQRMVYGTPLGGATDATGGGGL